MVTFTKWLHTIPERRIGESRIWTNQLATCEPFSGRPVNAVATHSDVWLGLVTPQVVEIPPRSRGVVTYSPKEPEISTAVCPSHGDTLTPSCAGNIACARSSKCAVDAFRFAHVAAPNPCPFLGSRAEFPKVV